MKQDEVIELFTKGKKILGQYVNGNHRTILYEDGSKLKETGYYINEMNSDGKRVNRWVDVDTDHMTYEFCENFDIKITDVCNGGCKYCHEGSTINGKHGDLKRIEPMIKTLQPGTEVAIGGGNIFEHPDLIWFLELLKKQGIITNITVNQQHLKPFKDTLMKIVSENLVNGIGVSVTDSSKKEDFEFLDTLGNNVVLQFIAGIFEEKDVDVIKNRKILFLGYKDLRRGHDHKSKNYEKIERNINWLKDVLHLLTFKAQTISFDDLGILQVDPQKAVRTNQATWNTLFQGHDDDTMDDMYNITCSTMYIDVPNMQVARSSTAPMDKRWSFNGDENIRELFKLSIKKC